MSDTQRITAWRKVVELGTRMGDDLMELMARQRLGDVVRPLE
jgi:hypothetical protein